MADRVKTVRLNIITDPGTAKEKLDAISAKADALGKADPTIKVKVDAAAAALKLKVLQNELKNTGTQADTASGKFDKLGASLAKAADSAKKSGGPAWLGPLLLSLPSLTTLAGVASGAVIGLGGALVAGGGALAAFGAVAKPVLSDALKAAQAVDTAQNNYNVAIKAGVKPATAWKAEQIAIGKAYAELSPQQIALSKQLGNMANAWQNLKAAQTPVVAGALQPWLRSVTDLTGKLGPVIHAVAVPIKEIGAQVDILINSSAFTTFRDWIAGTGSQVVSAVGSALTGFLDAVVTILPKFNPLIEKAVGWIAGLGPALAHWANSQKTADDISKFMAWFSQNGPVVGGLLKNLGGALKALAPGLTTGGVFELKAVSDFFGLIAKLPPQIAKPLAEVAGALLILNKLGVVSVGLKILGIGAAGSAAEGAAAGGLMAKILGPGVKFVGGVFIAAIALRLVGSLVPKNLSKQVAVDAAKQPSFAMKIDSLLHLTNIAGWIDANFSHPVRAFLENQVPQAFGAARAWIEKNFVQVLVRFFTSTLPLAFDLWKENVRLVFDKVKILALDAVLGISVAFGHLPGPLGAPFRTASAGIRLDLAKIQGDAANAAANINADWDKLHGKTVTLHFAFAGFPGQPPPGLAAGTSGAAPGWAVVGERGPEMIRMRGGEVVVPNHRLRGYANGVGDFVGVFPTAAQFAAGTAALQAAFNSASDKLAAKVKPPPSLGAHPGPGGGAPLANAMLAIALEHPTPAQFAAWNSVAMAESGWNQFALNPSSGAYGIAQALPPTKYPFAGQAAGGSNPTAQITWMWNYMNQVYGGPIGAWAHEQAFHWYGGGTSSARPGWAWVGEHGRELVRFRGGEQVIPHARGSSGGTAPQKITLEFRGSGHSDFDRFMTTWLQKSVVVRGGGSVQAAWGSGG